MKKTIMFCILNFCTSMHTFGMLTQRVNIITKNFISKTYSHKTQLNYEALFKQAVEENIHLKTEIALLKLKLEQVASHKDATQLSHLQKQKNFINLPDRSSDGGTYPHEE